MAKYRITDSQSGKTLVINGDSPPTEQEAEQLFQTSGIRGEQPIEQPKQSNILESAGYAFAPIAKMLLPNVIKYSQENLQKIGAGDTTPTKPNLQDILATAGGPATATLFGSPEEQTKQAAARELYSVLQGAKGIASGAKTLVKGGANIAKDVGEFAQNAGEAKTINPWKITGYARNKAAEAAGELNTEGLIKAGDEFVKKNPYAKDAWETFKPTITSKMDTKDLLGRMTDVFGQAYTRGGDVRTTAEAGLMNKLYGAGKEVLSSQAPDVAKQNAMFRFLYNAPKTIQRGTWLALKATAIGKMLGL